MISERILPSRPRAADRGLTLSLGTSWHRIALVAIVALSAILNVVGLSREGYDNEFYAAAVRSMAANWHAFLFNSFDPAGFVTIDKPPLGFWFQVASVKLFGFHGVSLLLPQALAGVLSVILLYHLVSRTFGRVAGLIAALALAVTPISVVTNRNNTIDSTLVLVVLLGAWAVLRAAETGREPRRRLGCRWLLLCAALVGLGFNIKMLEAYLVVPAFGLVYLLGARTSVWRRLANLVLALVVLLAISLSWVTAVDLTPASQRPWIDSTSTNSALDLAIGYNGLQRLTGNHSVSGTTQTTQSPGSASGTTSTQSASSQSSSKGQVSNQSGPEGNGNGGENGGPGGVGENGPAGVLRLLDTQLGSQIGWLLPLAVLGLLLALWQTRKRVGILDERQRSLVLWGMWLLTTGAFFSVALFYHTYYLVMMAPAVSALAGIAVASLWQEYRRPGARTWWLLPLCLLIAASVQVHVLADYPSWARWLTPLVVSCCVLAAIGLIVLRLRPPVRVRLAVPAAALAVLALLTPPAAFAAYTMQHTQTGAILRAGPGTSTADFGPGTFAGGPPNGSTSPPPNSASSGSGSTPHVRSGSNGTGGQPGPGAFGPPAGVSASGHPPFGRSSGGPGNPGGPGGGQVSTALITYLKTHRGSATYLVATPSSNEAAPIIIATGEPVMSLGGFSGSDPILTTAKLASLAKQGVVRYFLLDGRGPGGPGGSSSLTTWIQQHSRLLSVGGTQLYQYTGS